MGGKFHDLLVMFVSYGSVYVITNLIAEIRLFPCLQGESSAALGYRLELGALTMRGRVDSHGTVGAVVERRLDPLPATLMLSGHINHWTDDSRFGIAIMVG